MSQATPNVSGQSSVMRRLRKIMALTESSNPGEASAALHQAQVLMAKHNLTAEAVAQSTITESSIRCSGKDLPEWESRLAAVVSAALGVELLVESQRRQRGLNRSNASIVFVGKGCSTEIAAYAYGVLRRQMLSDLRALINKAVADLKIKNIKVTPTAAQRNAYASGWCHAAYAKVQAIRPDVDPVVTEYVKQRSEGKKAETKAARKLPEGAQQAFATLGYQQGKNARLSTAVNGGQASLMLNI